MNSQNKQQAIKAAYGEHWEKVKNYVEDNGWIELYSYNCYTDTVYTDLTEDLPFLKELGYERKYFNNGHTHYVRPKSLFGIETNRGWTRIESEEDLPKDRNIEDLLIFTETGEILVASSKYLSDAEIIRYWIKTVSHWQKFVKPNPPIF
ncbi:hypothetical protein ACH34C_07100 [Elizabethkingia anophelis]|uniref:hypothetical protein n=1 Tax=Elizabethkingia anophelis TaxID=1117645 RepID=UPI003787058E